MKKRKDGRYSTTISVGYDELGRRKQITIYGKTKDELTRNKAQVLLDVKHQVYVKDKSVTFGDYAQKWIRIKQIEVEDISMYRTVLKNYTSILNYYPLTRITKDDCQDIINKTLDKPRTCQKIKITLNQIFESAIEDNLLYKNPSKGITLPKYKSSEKRGLTSSERDILKAIDLTPREDMYITLIMYYGLRKEEALALTKNDFDFDNNILFIKKAVKFISNKPTEKSTKNGEQRQMYIFPDHIEKFKAYIDTIDGSHIFRTLQKNTWITEQSFKRMFESIINKMKAKADELNVELPNDLTSHIFRHGYATDLYYAGVGLKDAQYLLGHKTASVTMNIYTHLDKTQTDARDKLIAYHKKLEG